MRDTVNIIMNNDFTSAFTEMVKNNDSGIDPIFNVLITVAGMIAVAIITMLSQHWITKKNIRADFEKMHTQLKLDFEKVNSQLKTDIDKITLQVQTDFQMKMKFDWILNIRLIVADLLAETNPEDNYQIDRHKVIRLIHQSQIMLDSNKKDEEKLGSLITELGFVTNPTITEPDEMTDKIFNVQGRIVDCTREILKIKLNEKI